MREQKFNIGDVVFLKTDIDQYERMVCGILIRPDGIQYAITLGDTENWHYDIEISKQKDILKTTTN